MEVSAAAQVVARLSRAQKIALVSGADFWHTESLPGVPAFMLTDGPHGLRKQAGSSDHVGLSDSVPATCFPPAVGLGATWDVDLLEEVGAALGRETRGEDVGVLLGPGLNIKRHPAGGRCFEYFSEDPLVSGKAAAAMVRGIQSEGVGACLKHYAVNNQEAHRMRLDTIVDERTLREIYLTGFEIAVTEAEPWTVMSAYNLVNGEHAGESRTLLTDILRTQWGFRGLVMTDWFAAADRPVGLHAGLDLEMPSSTGAWDSRTRRALESGAVAEADLDLACTRVVELALRVEAASARLSPPVDLDAHHALARRAACAATVLLTNDGLLPLRAVGRIALVGAFAAVPRYQGAGSSQVTPTRVDAALDAMRARLGDDAELVYAPGYDPVTGETTPALLDEARRAVEGADAVVVLVGLPASYESEGFDRADLRLPAGHDALVEAVTGASARTAVVLVNGAPVEIPWAERPAALVEAYLGGQAGGSALVDVLVGDAEPGGRLAESFPVSVADLPAHARFANHPTQIQYRENLYVGYRFHDTFDVAPRFAFGHGLTYTTFEYSELAVTGTGTDRTITLAVTNTGERPGSEVVQVYVHDVDSTLHRPDQELRGFAKVHLLPGESREVAISLARRAFAVYDVADAAWKVEAGEFEVRVGASSRDIRLTASIVVESDDVVAPVRTPAGAQATDDEFEALLGHPIPQPAPLMPLHEDSTIDDLGQVWLGRRLRGLLLRMVTRSLDLGPDPQMARMVRAVVRQMPVRGIVMNSGGRLSFRILDAVLAVLNLGHRRASR
jgi:beta-glucosidase